MTALIFVDTNVLVYSRDASDVAKQEKASAWLAELWNAQRGRTSFQVLNEYYVTVTKKLDRAVPTAQAREDVEDLFSWDPITFSSDLLLDGWSLQDRFGFSWWDSLVVAAARASGSTCLLTEDLQHGQMIDELRIVSPFELEPHQVLSL